VAEPKVANGHTVAVPSATDEADRPELSVDEAPAIERPYRPGHRIGRASMLWVQFRTMLYVEGFERESAHEIAGNAPWPFALATHGTSSRPDQYS